MPLVFLLLRSVTFHSVETTKRVKKLSANAGSLLLARGGDLLATNKRARPKYALSNDEYFTRRDNI